MGGRGSAKSAAGERLSRQRWVSGSRMPVGKSPGLPKSAIAPSSANAGPLGENCYGPHPMAIRTVGTGASVCLSSSGLCNPIPGGSSAPQDCGKSVTEALFRMISLVGILKEILTDQGTAIMSRTIQELYELLGIESVRTSVYHPQMDGLVERFHRTLKTMIRKFVQEDAKNLDRWLEPLLFAVREVPQASTGFSLLWAPLWAPAPRGFGRPERDVGGGTFGEQEWNSTCAGPENKTPHLEAALHGEFVTGPGQAEPAVQSGNQTTQFCSGR